ncbi:MAG: low temperature requirement protein A [Solirubrobacterales bacterium]
MDRTVAEGETEFAEPIAGDPRADARVSTLELFFDLVFVFTITQLTSVLAHHPNGAGVLRVGLMLIVIWWMYGGYAWLTNVVAPDRIAYQLLLLGGMAAFLVISLAIPTAFAGGGIAFGVGYLVVVVIHSGLFSRSQAGESGLAILRVAPLNVTAALSILAGGIAGGTARGILWGIAVAVIILPSLRPPDPRFEIAPGHFVERHGLVVIVALGESVVAVGIGATAHALTAGLVAVAVLGLALSACLWWAYFGEGEDEKALEAMRSASPRERPRLALNGFYHWHLLILFGIIALASALESGIGHAGEELAFARALALAGGVACFLVGDALFRRTLRIGALRWRLAAAPLALATIPLGTEISAVTQLAALVAVLVACLTLELRGRPEIVAGP